jgi:hypothetical protein
MQQVALMNDEARFDPARDEALARLRAEMAREMGGGGTGAVGAFA